jgi:hypothetical protein
MALAPVVRFRQIPRVRWLPVIALVVAASSASAATISDPAFLGIGMDDAPGFCSIGNITPASPAQDAGLIFGDAIYAMDGQPVGQGAGSPCTNLTNQIVEHRAGDQIKLDVRRGGSRLQITATLSTRAEVLHRRFVGEHMLRTDLADVDDDKQTYDLGAHRGHTTIVGWFMLDRCTNCARVFDRISDGIRTRLKSSGTPPSVLAVTAAAPLDRLASVRKSFTAQVSLAVAEPDVFDALALKDSLRISFMVIDCRGVVRFVAPIAPDADDLDAAVDDILAAVEQAEYQRNRRN